MFDIDKWQEIYQTLKKHKLRTFLTAFGVFWGIFMLVVLLGASNGFQNGVMYSFPLQNNTIFLWSQQTSMPYQGMQPGRNIEMTNDDAMAIRDKVKELNLLAPRLQLNGEFVVKRNDKNGSYRVYGDYPDFFKIQKVKLHTGRFINDLDIKERRKVCIIGDRVREVLFKPDEDPIDKYIVIKGIFFKVIGIFGTEQKGNQAIRELESIYMPSTTMQYTYNMVNRIYWMAMTPKKEYKGDTLEAKVKALLSKRHKVSPEDTKAFGGFNLEKELNKMFALFNGIKAFAWVISVFTIIAGVVGVGNIMLIVVKERTKEIGVRKAIGATPWSIISLIVQEALVLTTIAGYFGLVMGVALIEGINYILVKTKAESDFFANPEIDFKVAITALTVLVLAGTLAGFFPALKASKVNPVVALKDE